MQKWTALSFVLFDRELLRKHQTSGTDLYGFEASTSDDTHPRVRSGLLVAVQAVVERNVMCI